MTDTVLITGGLGYLGGRVARFLIEQSGLSIRVGTRQRKITPQEWLKGGMVMPLDLLSERDLDTACRGVRYVVHLAALNEIDSETDPEQALLVNGLGTLKLLRASERARVERFIYVSTAHVYGAPLVGTITEKTLPRPVHPYAVTHKTGEDFVLAACAQGVTQAVVLRLSNGFGAPVDASIARWTLVTNDLCRQAVTTRKLELRSSGLQRRDFITLFDISRAVAHFLNMPASAYGDGLFNLGGECSLRIIDLTEHIADRCRKAFGFTPSIIRPDSGPAEPHPLLDYRIDKLKATGFVLKGSVDEEIDATLQLCLKAFGTTS
ncbi:SDR family oxidoreductase [Nitrospiraceae bacterium AH_259_D15_M11_P09]|nr:SDR family oxidoreductase [Nitrospiraceae bacterium AH_259_D15_M11_P09]